MLIVGSWQAERAHSTFLVLSREKRNMALLKFRKRLYLLNFGEKQLWKLFVNNLLQFCGVEMF